MTHPSPEVDDAFHRWQNRYNAEVQESSIRKYLPIGRLFTCEQYDSLAEEILRNLDVRSILRCSQVCKQLNRTISHSSPLQLRLRYVYHQHPKSTWPQHYTTSNEELQTLISMEKNIHTLTPQRSHSIPLEKNSWSMLYQDYLFTGLQKVSQSDPLKNSEAWDMYDLSEEKGPSKVMSGSHGGEVLSMIMVPKDNLIVHVARNLAEASGSLSFRIHFYQLNPATTTHKWHPVPHPEALYPYIDIGKFPHKDLYTKPMIASESTDKLLFCVGSSDGDYYGWLGILEWRRAVFIGCIDTPDRCSPPFEADLIDDTLITCTSERLAQEIPLGMDESEFTAKSVNLPCFVLWSPSHDHTSDVLTSTGSSSWDYDEIASLKMKSAFVIPTSKMHRYTSTKENQEECEFSVESMEIRSRVLPTQNEKSTTRGIFLIDLMGESRLKKDESFQEFLHTSIVVDLRGIQSMLRDQPEVLHYDLWRKYGMAWYDLPYIGVIQDVSGSKYMSIQLDAELKTQSYQATSTKARMNSKNGKKIKTGTITIRDFHPSSTLKNQNQRDESFHDLPIGTIGNIYSNDQNHDVQPIDVVTGYQILNAQDGIAQMSIHADNDRDPKVRFEKTYGPRNIMPPRDDNGKLSIHKEHLPYTEICGKIDMEVEIAGNGREKTSIKDLFWDGKRIVITMASFTTMKMSNDIQTRM